MLVRIHAYVYMHTYTYVYAHTYTHKYINTYICTYVSTHVCVAAEDRIQSQISLCGILGGEIDIGMDILIRTLPVSRPVLLQHRSVSTFLSPNIDAI